MGTQVLAAHDYLIQSNSDVFYGRRKRRQTNNNSHLKSNVLRNLEKRTSSSINRSPSAPVLTEKHQNKKQCFAVTKFGERVLTEKHENKKQRFAVTKFGQCKPAGIKTSPTKYDDSYAGSACFLSPSPRCLPLPSFFSKNQGSVTAVDQNCDDTVTKDLRRLLRLE